MISMTPGQPPPYPLLVGFGARQEGGQTIFESGDTVTINPAAFTQLGLDDNAFNRGTWTVVDDAAGFRVARGDVIFPIDPSLLTLIASGVTPGGMPLSAKIVLGLGVALAVGATIWAIRS